MNNIVPTNAPSIFDVLKALTTLEQNAIVRPANPPPGIAGFLFDIKGEESITLESDVTDNYVENNTAIQDQVGLRPEKVSVEGMVAEIAQTTQQVDEVTKQNDALPMNTALQPEYTEIQIDQIAEAEKAEALEVQSKIKTQSLDGFFNSRTAITNGKQARAFSYFYQLWKGRQLFTVDTPWGFFTDMIIENIRVSQDETTRIVSKFRINFKKMRFAEQIIISSGQLAGRAALQAADKTQNGVAGKEAMDTPKNESWLYQLSR
jgi:hypothetical protein